MNRLGASAGPAIIAAWLVASGKMTILEGLIIGIVTLFIGWIATPFGKPIRQAIEDWLDGSADSNPCSPAAIENERFHNRRKGSLIRWASAAIFAICIGILIYAVYPSKLPPPVLSLHEPRVSHFAVELTDRRIVFIGGRMGGGMLGTTEIYDPNNQTISVTASSPLPISERSGAAIWLKGMKKIFVWQGKNVELYDAVMNEFQSVPAQPLSSFGAFSTATVLGDGKVLLAGGTNARKKTEIYDPRTGKFSRSVDFSREREAHATTLLQDGHVLITGGDNVNAAELFDVKNGPQLTGEMRQARQFHTAVRLNSGDVFILGGMADGRILSSTEIYSAREGKFRAGPSMAVARWGHTATRLPDGCVVVIGGLPERDAHARAIDVVEKICPDGDEKVAKEFVRIGGLHEARAFHTSTLLNSSEILVAGGARSNSNEQKDMLKSIEIVPIKPPSP